MVYHEHASGFEQKDAWYALLALLLSAVGITIVSLPFVSTYTQSHEAIHHFWVNWPIYISLLLNAVIVVGIVFILVRVKSQKILSLGLGKKNILKSLGLAVAMCAVFSLFHIGRIFSDHYTFSTSMLAPTISLLFVASFKEELLFRAYVGPRFYGIFKDKGLSVFVTGLSFAAMHIITRIGAVVMGFDHNWILSELIILMVIWVIFHALYHWLYAKYNNIWGPTLLHAYRNFLPLAFVASY